MNFTGRYAIRASPETVWAALNDPEILKRCVPGCESLAKTDETHFAATATLRIGPVKATFKAAISQTDLDPPRRCILSGEGQGGVAGFARGEAEVILTPENDGTLLAYTAKAAIGGKLAQIGQRLLDGAAKQIADDFFGRFAALLAAPAAAPAAPALLPAEQAPDPRPANREGLRPAIWVVGLLAAIAILLVLFAIVE